MLVLVLVDTVVLGVVVVVVVGLSVVVVVVGVSVDELGSWVCVTVSVPPVWAGATEPPADVDDAVVLEVLDVPDVLDVELDPLLLVSATTP